MALWILERVAQVHRISWTPLYLLVEFLPLSTCFQITSFDRCIYGIDPNDSSSTPISALSIHVLVTLYRYYPHCPLLHWSRGFCEVFVKNRFSWIVYRDLVVLLLHQSDVQRYDLPAYLFVRSNRNLWQHVLLQLH